MGMLCDSSSLPLPLLSLLNIAGPCPQYIDTALEGYVVSWSSPIKVITSIAYSGVRDSVKTNETQQGRLTGSSNWGLLLMEEKKHGTLVATYNLGSKQPYHTQILQKSEQRWQDRESQSADGSNYP